MPFQHPLKIVLSHDADRDLENILQYTLLYHGDRQMDDYHALLVNGFGFIAENPNIGTSSHSLPDGYQRFPVEKHRIIYKVEAATIFIARILHQKTEMVNHVH